MITTRGKPDYLEHPRRPPGLVHFMQTFPESHGARDPQPKCGYGGYHVFWTKVSHEVDCPRCREALNLPPKIYLE